MKKSQSKFFLHQELQASVFLFYKSVIFIKCICLFICLDNFQTDTGKTFLLQGS